MQYDEVAVLCNEASALEKEYAWVEANSVYKKALEQALKKERYCEGAEFSERIGYAYFRAALQAETSENFQSRMCLSSEAYKKELEILQNVEGAMGKALHAKAMVAYSRSWFEADLDKMETLLEEWWRLENEALVVHEREQNHLAIGKTCNNLMEYSVDRRVFFNRKEYLQRGIELRNLGEKAITFLEKTESKYELARAYCWTAWYYGKSAIGIRLPEKDREKAQNYSKKALSLSEDVGDGWLIGWSYNTMSDVLVQTAQDFSNWLCQALKVIGQGKIIKDNYMMATGKWKAGWIIHLAIDYEEDPERKRQESRKAVEWNREAISQAKLINAPILILLAQLVYCNNLISLASLEMDLQEKRKLTEEAIEAGNEGLKLTRGRDWTHGVFPLIALSRSMLWLSKTETNNQRRRRYLEEALKMREGARAKIHTYGDPTDPQAVPSYNFVEGAYQIALIESEIAKLETDQDQRISLFNQAILSWKDCLKLAERIAEAASTPSEGRSEGFYYYGFGDILSEVYRLTQEKTMVSKGVEAYNKAVEFFIKFDLPIHAAEAYWKLALIYDLLGEHLEASKSYEKAAKAYNETHIKTPQLTSFCQDQARYMSAWSQIEKALHHHIREENQEAKRHYENAAKLHEESSYWGYMAPNYRAWATLENAELLSRLEKPENAILSFEQAEAEFGNVAETMRKKTKEIELAEEKQAAEKLVRASSLRRRYCQARINIEEAKILDRKGEYMSSSKKYGDAANKLGQLLVETETTQTKQELTLLLKFCEAWEKMELAEENADPDRYLEAAQLFEEAKTHSLTRKTALLILGNSSFCKGLAAGMKYRSSLESEEHDLAKGYLKNAATSYLQAGFISASEYAKATQRLFDAYVFMNKAEVEVDQESRAKHYEMADKLLQISAEAFTKAKQPEKTSQVQQILETVREERDLAVSLDEVLHAPAIASTTTFFSSPNPAGEVSVGLEQFEHANIQANLICSNCQPRVGESFSLEVEFVNAGKEAALIIKVEEIIPEGFLVNEKPEIYRLEGRSLNMKGKQLAPLKSLGAKLALQPLREGSYRLKPRVQYIDELGMTRFLHIKSVEIKVEEIVLERRVSTGTRELDSLLLGGIPEGYVVALTAPPSDERDSIVRRFLEAGTDEDQTTFYVTTETVDIENILKRHTFYLILCNPEPRTELPELPNIHRLRSKTDLNSLNIALTKAFRDINQTILKPKRIFMEIISDILLHYNAETTRRWLSGLIGDATSKGFTLMAVINPLMHPPDQLHAILDLFDGEISLYESEDSCECRRLLRVKKLRNQDYIKNPICLIQQES